MNNEKQVAQVPSNADGNTRETHDDDSALRSDWGSDESDTECHGDGRPRDSPDELPVQPQALDEHQGLLLPQSGAQAPDFIRGYDALTEGHTIHKGLCRPQK